MVFSINEMRAQLAGGGSRPTHFSVQFINPANGSGDIKIPFMTMATQIPTYNEGEVNVPYFGRRIKVAGDRTWENWTVTVLNDTDFLIRNALEEWSNKINSFEGNLRTFGSSSPLEYKSQAILTRYTATGVPTRIYTLEGIWPTQISSIDLAWNATDQIEQFQATFAFDWCHVSGGSTGNAGGE